MTMTLKILVDVADVIPQPGDPKAVAVSLRVTGEAVFACRFGCEHSAKRRGEAEHACRRHLAEELRRLASEVEGDDRRPEEE